MRIYSRFWLFVLAVCLLAPIEPGIGAEATVQVLHSFQPESSANTGGVYPQTLVLGVDDRLYGLTSRGGQGGGGIPGGNGVLFRMERTGSGFSVLHNFPCTGPSTDRVCNSGVFPYLLTNATDGFVYGLTAELGPGAARRERMDAQGTMFKIKPDGTNFSVLRTFCVRRSSSSSCAANAAFGGTGLLPQPDGSIIGTLLNGGSAGRGEVYRLSSEGVYSTLHAFSGAAPDGGSPTLVLDGGDSFFYGIASSTIFKISASGSFSVLASMAAADVANGAIENLLMGKDGHLYGTAYSVETSTITITRFFFRVTRSGVLTKLFTFPQGEAGKAEAGSREIRAEGDDGFFYGVASGQSSAPSGSIFRIAVDGTRFETLYAFPAVDSATQTNTTGARPVSLAFASDGRFYGIAAGGGSGGTGTAFKLARPAPGVSITASPSTITTGQSSTLTWNAADSTSCTASGAWSGARPVLGSATVTPPAAGQHQYVLTCVGPEGSGSGTTTVSASVPPPRPIVKISSHPEVQAGRNNASVAWSSNGASTCEASGDWSGSKPLSGSQGLSLETPGTYVFSLSCTNLGGTTTASTTTRVKPPEQVRSFLVSPAAITLGQTAVLTWDSENVSACAASGEWTGPKTVDGSETITPDRAGVLQYFLSCGSAGATVELTVNAIPEPPAGGSSGGGGGGAMSLEVLSLLALLACLMSRKQLVGRVETRVMRGIR